MAVTLTLKLAKVVWHLKTKNFNFLFVAQTLTSNNSALATLLARRPVILQFLRFGTIGALNTALDFAILNYITERLGVHTGVELGALNFIGVGIAIINGYLWNRAWTFTKDNQSVMQNFWRLFLVGGLGFVTFLAVVVAAAYNASPAFYLLALAGFIAIELIFWFAFGLSMRNSQGNAGVQFVSFLLVSIIGLVINSFVLAIASSYLAPLLSDTVNIETVKNIAKFLAICVSLVWNFIGYKVVVFRR
jgi:putative flippase GtrA